MFYTNKIIISTITLILLSSALYSTIINIPVDQTTIQAGINASANADTVLVQPGTYVENINFNGKLITLASKFLTTQDTTYILSTIIDGNAASRVVSFVNSENSLATLTGFTITNGSTTYGGGIYCNGASPTLRNLIITGNTASFAGGGISCYNCSPTLKNVEIVNNIANNRAGGVNCENNSNTTFENVTIVGNAATYYGGGIFCDTNSSPIVINSILWNNLPTEIYLNFSTIAVSYSDIMGGYPGTAIINADPLFVDPANGDYHLTENSPCIDSGDLSSSLDPDGTIVDIGAYYFHHEQREIWHISTTGSDVTGNGSEESPFASIQLGINFANSSNTVLVQPGTYVENINYNGKLVTVGSLFLTTQDTTYISSTIIDGNATGSVVTFNHGEDITAVLNGFTISNGLGGVSQGGGISCINSSPILKNLIITGNSAFWEEPNWPGPIWHGNGGGIYCTNSSPVLINVIISNNSAVIYGGGIYCKDNCNLSLENVIISNNTASGYTGAGGGIYCYDYCNLSLENVIISDNTSDSGGGGGFYCFYYCNLNFENVTISGNSTDGGGGGITIIQSNAILQNVTIADNSAANIGGGADCEIFSNISFKTVSILNNNSDNFGGGMYISNSTNSSLENVTISGNAASNLGGGIYCNHRSEPSVINSILWNNSPQEIFLFDESTITVSYSDIQGGYTGTGNIDSDPLFVDPAIGDYNLQPTSPCIDAGDPASPLDPDGTITDMGAFYSHQIAGSPNANFTADSMNGYPPLAVNFIDLSFPGGGTIDEWFWDFGDGNSSTLKDPFNEYQLPGIYTVSLIVANVYDSTDTEIKVGYINVYGSDDPASPTGFQVDISGDDAILTWASVDTTLSGYTTIVTAYVVYNSIDPYSNFSFEGFIADTTYTHQSVAKFSDKMFYQVSAYTGSLRSLQNFINEHPKFNKSELDAFIKEKRIKNNINRIGN